MVEKIYHVISHTHWDREWYQSFEEFRYRAVKLFDNLLDIYKEYPDYIFHMDAQTLIIEDYLEIRPQRREEVLKYIRSGNLLVGPWFVQSDFHLTSGEAIIRNLLSGRRLAENMGACQYAGYTPDQFGLCSQLPQILQGFGIDNCIFGRGYKKLSDTYEEFDTARSPTEFSWQAPDGSAVLGISLHHWYNNAQRFSSNPEKARRLVEHIEENTSATARTPHILLMNGVDHLEAQEDLLPILKRLNRDLPKGQEIRQSTLSDYITAVKTWFQDTDPAELPVEQGEMRHGGNHQILMNTASSRVHLKQHNFKLQNLLERVLEPLWSFIRTAGAADMYPADHLEYQWRLLMQNHPHESICGCSRDAVHAEMETRFQKVEQLGNALKNDALSFISNHIDRSKIDDKDYLLTIFNSSIHSRSEVIETDIILPVDDNVKYFEILDENDNPLSYVIKNRQPKKHRTLSPINLPGQLDTDYCRVQLETGSIPALGYAVLRIRAVINEPVQNITANTTGRTVADQIVMENELLKTTVHADGLVNLLDKKSGFEYKDLISFIDREDIGHAYIYRSSDKGKTYSSKDYSPEIKLIESTPLRQRCRLTFDLQLPTDYDYMQNCRSELTDSLPLLLDLVLDKGAAGLKLEIKLNNMVKDHRLRLLVNTGFETDSCLVSQPFDIVHRRRPSLPPEVRNPDEPNSGMLCVEENNRGIAVFNRGLYEYEYPVGEKGQFALTLVRSNNRISGASAEEISEDFHAPGNQIQRKLSYETCITPYQEGHTAAGMMRQAEAFHSQLVTGFYPADHKKFTGGRPAVQDSDLGELFFRPLPYPDIILPLSTSFCTVKGDNIELSALKQSEDRKMLVLRLWNSSIEDRLFSLDFCREIKEAFILDLKEDIVSDLRPTGSQLKDIPAGAKDIVTIGLKV